MSHHDRPYPGKMEGNPSRRLAEALYSASLQGCDDEIGSVMEGFGWYGLILRPHVGIGYVVSEDARGFFGYDRLPIDEARERWARIEREYADFWADVVQPEGSVEGQLG